jgi:hypothetical protein
MLFRVVMIDGRETSSFTITHRKEWGWEFRFVDKGDQELKPPHTPAQVTACSRAFLVCGYVVRVLNAEKQHFLCVPTTLGFKGNCNIFSWRNNPYWAWTTSLQCLDDHT